MLGWFYQDSLEENPDRRLSKNELWPLLRVLKTVSVGLHLNPIIKIISTERVMGFQRGKLIFQSEIRNSLNYRKWRKLKL